VELLRNQINFALDQIFNLKNSEEMIEELKRRANNEVLRILSHDPPREDKPLKNYNHYQ
jgi:hypothetical protein